MSQPVLIDWFCRDGGASMGFHRAGFKVVGVDITKRRHYPFKFVHADALDLFREPPQWVLDADAHAGGPPCQRYSHTQRIMRNDHPDLIPPTREAFERFGKPWVIENVEGAPLKNPVLLCGAMFPELNVYRHRLFEASFPVQVPGHPKHKEPTTKMGRAPRPGERMFIVGNFIGVAEGKKAMGIDWMAREGLREAVPPAYTQLIGEQLLAFMKGQK